MHVQVVLIAPGFTTGMTRLSSRDEREWIDVRRKLGRRSWLVGPVAKEEIVLGFIVLTTYALVLLIEIK